MERHIDIYKNKKGQVEMVILRNKGKVLRKKEISLTVNGKQYRLIRRWFDTINEFTQSQGENCELYCEGKWLGTGTFESRMAHLISIISKESGGEYCSFTVKR